MVWLSTTKGFYLYVRAEAAIIQALSKCWPIHLEIFNMSQRSLDRRTFLSTGVVAATGAFHYRPRRKAPAGIVRKVAPAAVCSSNGQPYLEETLERLARGDDTLDVAVWAVSNVEKDPKDMSVGYGGYPNEDGIVELDSCCMHGPSNNCGSVASLRNIKTPAAVARDVLWTTDHVMLVGEGALRFAKSRGFKEEDLLTEPARRAWLRWRARRSKTDDWLEDWEKRPQKEKDKPSGKRETGTINFDCCNAKGEVSGVTTTSGLAFKIPGRVGDSPIIGAGLYVDGAYGAAGSAGRGESVIQACASHVIIEALRRGLHPTDACLEATKRIIEMNKVPYLRDEKGSLPSQLPSPILRR